MGNGPLGLNRPYGDAARGEDAAGEFPQGRGSRRPGCLVAFLLFGGFFLGIFGLSAKLTEAYSCSLSVARRSPVVVAELGEPVEPGFFAWLYGYSQEGSVTDTSFRTSLAGPKGEGTMRVGWYRSPVGSSLWIELEKGGRKQVVYSGTIPCR